MTVQATVKAFSAAIREACADLDAENGNPIGTLLAEINRRNSEEADAMVCATHDFFDANMGMLAAFQTVFNREPDCASEADVAIINTAWDEAKASGFMA